MKNQKPSVKYRTVKCSLKTIIKKKKNILKIHDVMIKTHKLIIHTYQFLRLWILEHYHQNKDIPAITIDIIKMAFKSLTLDSTGPKPKGNNLKLYNEFKDFYENYKLYFSKKTDSTNLSQILGYMATDMLTNIENNIKLNFMNYIRRFVNSSFKKQHNDILENTNKGKKTEIRKQLNKDLYEIKQDLFNNTLLSNQKYHDWINKHKNNIFPSEYKNSYEFDVQNDPQKYIKYMIYVCLEIEKFDGKAFQFFPLRTDISAKYIPIDNKTLIELFVNENKNDYLTDIENTKYKLWKKYFKLNNPIFTQKNYSFDYRISTDCHAVSIQLIHNDFIDKEKQKKANMKNKKNDMKIKCKDMSQEQKEKFKAELKLKKKQEQEQIKLKNKEARDKQKTEYNKMSKEQKEEYKQKIKKDKDEKNKNKYIEFPYLEDLDDNQLNELKNNDWCTNDPGKKKLLYMKNKYGKRFRYSNKEHIKNIKRLKYQRLIKNYKDKCKITKIENMLSNYNSKTCDLTKFKNYIFMKNTINEILFDQYQETIFQKYKWYAYINKKKAYSKLIKKIKNTFGKETIIAYGDWSNDKQIKNYISTPNLGLKRKIAEHFTVYNLNEFRTSKLNYKTEEVNENMYMSDKKEVVRKMHSVLTYQTENKSLGCINRDENSVNNMIKIVNYYLEHKKRPFKFTRECKLEDITSSIKGGNLIKVGTKTGSSVTKPAKVQLR